LLRVRSAADDAGAAQIFHCRMLKLQGQAEEGWHAALRCVLRCLSSRRMHAAAAAAVTHPPPLRLALAAPLNKDPPFITESGNIS